MATIIKSIAFKNFYNYYGGYEKNIYQFKEGLNIINADNGMGKSKLYNGFLWIIKDQVYDSDRRHSDDIKSSALKMLSDKSKINDDLLDTGVRIIFEDDEFEYTVEKTIHFSKRLPNPSTSKPEDWNIDEQKVNVLKVIKANGTGIPVIDIDEQNKIIKTRLISPELQSYALLQGEAIDNIVDLTSSEGLTKTVNTLTNIDNLEKLNDIAAYLLKKSDKDLSDKQNEFTRNLTQFSQLSNDKASQESLLDQLNIKIIEYRIELRKASDEKERLLSKISTTKKRTEAGAQIKNLEKKISDQVKKSQDIKNGINNNLFNGQRPWLLLGANTPLDDFANKRDEYLTEKSAKVIMKNPNSFFTVLPEGSPDSISLNKMVEDEKCYVCGRDAKKGTNEWLHIVQIKDRPKNTLEDVTKNNFSPLFGEIQKNVQSYFGNIKFIFDDIVKTRLQIKSIDDEIESLKKDKDSTLQEFLNFGGTEKSDQSEEDINMLNAYNRAEQDIFKNNDLIKKTDAAIILCNTKIEDFNKKLRALGGDNVPKEYEELKVLMNDLKIVFHNTKERVYNEVIKNLEEKSNQHYNELTKGNNVLGGTLKFNKTDFDTIHVDVVTENGDSLFGASEGYQRMKKLAIVMAIISSKIGVKQFEYPFIADAPFSSFGKNFINNFFTAVPSVFKQSIILIKDLYNPESDNYLTEYGEEILNKMKNNEIKGTFYVNYVDEKSDTLGLITKYKCYKS